MCPDTTLTMGPGEERQVERTPSLTILAHADREYVGRQCMLLTRKSLSRLEPAFSHPPHQDGLALNDPFLSRSPVVFTPGPGGVTIDATGTSITVDADGVTLNEARSFDHDALDRGVVLCLNKRVTLLLHRRNPLAARPAEDYGLVGQSDGLARVQRDITTVSGSEVPVLIRGESGTGKELVARAIHASGLRAQRHYEALNMATVPASLAGSELFGHVKGAFTGADRNHEGCFVRAHGGTLFLDEIGDTPVDIQAQLLRVLETHDVRPIGASRDQVVDVRVIAATDTNLEQAIGGGSFREALLQRLAGFQLYVPALRERREDIGALVYHFVAQELAKLGASHLLAPTQSKRLWLSPGTVARLARHDWPGNIRELKNVIGQLVLVGHTQEEIAQGSDLERLLRPARAETKPTPAPPAASSEPNPDGRYRDPSDVSEDELITALREFGYRLAPTAKALNLSRTSLYAMVERSGRIRKAADLGAEEIRGALAAERGNLARAAASLEVSAHALKLRVTALGIQE